MLTQGVAEQTVAPRGGYSNSHEQALKTHKENLLRMVSKILYACTLLLVAMKYGNHDKYATLSFDRSVTAKMMWTAGVYFNWSILERGLILHFVEKPVITA